MGEKWKKRFKEEGCVVKGEKGVKTEIIAWKHPLLRPDEHIHEGVAYKNGKKEIFSVIRKNKK